MIGSRAALRIHFLVNPVASVAALTILMMASAIADDLRTPWIDPQAALVIDPYYANTINWDRLQTDTRVVAIIHKATIGTSALDPAYQARKAEAMKRGYLWGSYHWGTAGKPEQQADYYLDTVKPAADELIALDLEDVNSSRYMSAPDALLFIKRIQQRTGRYPVVYTNHTSAVFISQHFSDTDFARTPLWYARYLNAIPHFPAGIWPTYTLWQFSTERKTQITLPGVKSDMDVSVAHGTQAELRQRWPLS